MTRSTSDCNVSHPISKQSISFCLMPWANTSKVVAFTLTVSSTKERLTLVHFGDLHFVLKLAIFWSAMSVPPLINRTAL